MRTIVKVRVTVEDIGTLPLPKMVAYPPQRASTRGNRTQPTETWGARGAPAVRCSCGAVRLPHPQLPLGRRPLPGGADPPGPRQRLHRHRRDRPRRGGESGAAAGGSAPRVRAGQPALAHPGPPRRGADPHPGRVRLRPGPAGPRRRGGDRLRARGDGRGAGGARHQPRGRRLRGRGRPGPPRPPRSPRTPPGPPRGAASSRSRGARGTASPTGTSCAPPSPPGPP